MTKKQPSRTRTVVFWIPFWQLVVALVMAAMAAVLYGKPVAKSVLTGGLVSAIGSVAFAISVFAGPTLDARDVLRRMFRGEALKLALVAVLFYLAIVMLRVQALPTMIGFLATLVVFWVALLRALK